MIAPDPQPGASLLNLIPIGIRSADCLHYFSLSSSFLSAAHTVKQNEEQKEGFKSDRGRKEGVRDRQLERKWNK